MARGYIVISSSVVYVPFVVPWTAFSSAAFDEDAVLPAASRSTLSNLTASTDAYMQGKLDAEDALWASVASDPSFCGVALRLPYVLGRKDSTHRLAVSRSALGVLAAGSPRPNCAELG